MATETVNRHSDRRPSAVAIDTEDDLREYEEDRKKILTMKYGAHQMKLIRKRLGVEFWMDDQLKKLYNVQVLKTKSCHKIIIYVA